MKQLLKLFFKNFKFYRRLEIKVLDYETASKLIAANPGKPEHQQWHIAKEEDWNDSYGLVILERKARITG